MLIPPSSDIPDTVCMTVAGIKLMINIFKLSSLYGLHCLMYGWIQLERKAHQSLVGPQDTI